MDDDNSLDADFFEALDEAVSQYEILHPVAQTQRRGISSTDQPINGSLQCNTLVPQPNPRFASMPAQHAQTFQGNALMQQPLQQQRQRHWQDDSPHEQKFQQQYHSQDRQQQPQSKEQLVQRRHSDQTVLRQRRLYQHSPLTLAESMRLAAETGSARYPQWRSSDEAVMIGQDRSVLFPSELMEPLSVFAGYRRIQLQVDGVQQRLYEACKVSSRPDAAGLGITTDSGTQSLVIGRYHCGWQVFEDGTPHSIANRSVVYLRDRTLLLVLSTTPRRKMTLEECLVPPPYKLERKPDPLLYSNSVHAGSKRPSYGRA